RLTCSNITYALLASYVLQSEVGDREARVSTTLLSAHDSVPLHVLTPDLEEKIDELYRKHNFLNLLIQTSIILAAMIGVLKIVIVIMDSRLAQFAAILLSESKAVG
ncbi:jg27370, partial [Pararge aegeria aegeria]